MNYLLVNHIAAHAGRDAAHLWLPQAWARDLAASARAAREVNARLIVATPLATTPPPDGMVELVPDAEGFEHLALPYYDSARTFLHERPNLSTKLASAISAADVVQLDLGGHPMPLGFVADPLARAASKPTLWVIAGEHVPDLRPASESRSATKRMVGRTLGTRVRRSLSEALRHAGGIVMTCATASDELRERHGIDASLIETLDVTADEVVDDATIARRHAQLLDASQPLRLIMTGDQIIDRNASHVLAAMHRCWRLRAPVTLVAGNRGTEADAVRKQARELGLESAVTLVDSPAIDAADLIVDPALTKSSRIDLEHSMARGVPAIAYTPRRVSPGVVAVPRGAVDELADAIFRAATDRAWLASQMLLGHAWVRERTIDAAHRHRLAIAAELVKPAARGAA